MGKSRGNQSTFRIDIQRALGAIYTPSQFVQAPVTQFQEIQRTQEYPTCPAGYYMSGNRCVPVPPCPRGQVFSVINGRCEQSYVSAPKKGNASCVFAEVDPFDPEGVRTEYKYKTIKYDTVYSTAEDSCIDAGAVGGEDCLSGNCCGIQSSSGSTNCYCKTSAGKWTSRSSSVCCQRTCSTTEKNTILGS